jgi:hypothetical protein
MVTQTFTLTEFKNYINRLPARLEKYSGDINMEIAKDLQRRVRMRAPNGSTGSLKRVKLDGTPKKVRLIGPAHWSYVNAGVAPMKMLPLEVAREHKAFPGSTAGKKVDIPRESIDGWFFAGYTQGKGFVTNSIQATEAQLPKIVERGLNKAFSK